MASDDLYDAYLEACLAGETQEPGAFLASHPDASPEVRAAIEAVYRTLGDRDPTDEALPFERLGEFKLLERLDAGGMGSIYLAEQESLGRIVALKVIRPELQQSEEARARFDREAQSAARLRHENIVTVFAAGADQGVRYLAMEMVPGRQLNDILAQVALGGDALPLPRLVGWIAQLARALDYAHTRGIVHRDVKPANIRITADGRPLLIDFGIAYDMGGDMATLTRSFAGSPTYAAPEQISDERGDVDGRTDVYALGVTLYQCITGVVPFSANTVEGVFHRTLHEEPTPPRRLQQTVGRELEIVTLKAMEKDPSARYQSAGEFAGDLEAILAYRPIRARPPGFGTRLYKWGRRRPAIAVAVGGAVAAVIFLAALFAYQSWDARRQRQERASTLVAEARRAIDAYRTQRTESAERESRYSAMEKEVNRRYFTPQEDLRIAVQRNEMESGRRAHEAAFYRILELLRQAEQTDPEVSGAEQARALLYLERWEEARALGNVDAQTVYRSLVRKHDERGSLDQRFTQRGNLTIASDPPGAECYLFRYRELRELSELGERRVVPVPVAEAGEPAVPHGTTVLRVARGAGAIETGDLILEREGEQARIYHFGEIRRAKLPYGLVIRRTAAPVFASPACMIGRTPVVARDLEIGDYLVVLRLKGRELQRRAVRVAGEASIEVRLLPTGSTPDGFVHVPADSGGPAFWIKEHEVTCAEYLRFLNNATVQASPNGTLAPRDQHEEYWTKDEAGAYSLPEPWRPDHPVVGISWHDAMHYLRWLGKRDNQSYALPTEREWTRAGGEWTLSRIYPFGRVFRPKWASSCWAQPKAKIEAVMSYPVDESPLGVFDMSGSAMEWLDANWGGDPKQRWLAGGAWGYSNPELFKLPGGWGAPPHAVAGTYGFRMVLR